MSNTAVTNGRPASRKLDIALLVVAAIVLIPAYLLFKTDVWEGDVPVVVASVTEHATSVKLPVPMPPDALRSKSFGSDIARETPAGVEVGEPLTCRVRQTYQVNTDFDNGPRTVVQRCWR